MRDWKIYGIVILLLLLLTEIACLGEYPVVTRADELEVTAPAAPPPSHTPAPTPMPTPSPTPAPTPTPLPLPDAEHMWQLAIASADYPMAGEYEVETVAVDGYLFDARAAGELKAMLDAAQADGMNINITSAWRSRATQAELYENRVYRFQLEGYSREEAEEIGAVSYTHLTLPTTPYV